MLGDAVEKKKIIIATLKKFKLLNKWFGIVESFVLVFFV